MKKPRITEGKWTLILEGKTPRIGVRRGQMIVPVLNEVPFSTTEQRNNAQSISAVPEMIDALINMKQFIENGVEFGYICLPEEGDSALDTIAKIDKALKKAGCTDA